MGPRFSIVPLVVLATVLAAFVAGCSARPSPTASAATAAEADPSTGGGAAETDLSRLRRVALPAEHDRAHAPGFADADGWLNVDHPLTLKELEGRVVVVDFWTSCCVNCLQTLPVLRALEAQFARRPVVVIGVHSPKFAAEQRSDRLREIVAAYDIRHPVALDSHMAVWDAWGVMAWPTVTVLDAQGRLVWAGSGEPDRDQLFGVVASALDEAAAAGKLARGPLPGLGAPAPNSAEPLLYPGKVAALADGGLAVSDTAHNRIVLVDRTGALSAIIGSGLPGRQDGDFATASFSHPEGVAQRGDELAVADTENHLIRVANLRERTVRTVAGDGSLGASPLPSAWAPAAASSLRSPWDVHWIGQSLYIALAGSHQIGELDLSARRIRAWAGSGREARVDGGPTEAAFAQPSALATDGRSLFVLDSESSSVRAVDLTTRQVRTVVGKDLFVFGDRDGPASVARLQHPLGLAYGDGAIWVADTYNNKVKRVDPETGETRSLGGSAAAGALFEPAGLAWKDGMLWVADTDHHRVMRIDPRAGTAEPWKLSGVEAPAPGVTLPTQDDQRARGWPWVKLGPVPIPRAHAARLRIEWQLAPGTGINDEAPYRLRWMTADGLAGLPADSHGHGRDIVHGIEVALPPSSSTAQAIARGELELVICDTVSHRVCVPVRRKVELGLVPTERAADEVVHLPLPAAL